MPPPFLVSVPVPVVIAELMVVLPLVPKSSIVRFWFAPVTAPPEMVSVCPPVTEVISVAPVSVMPPVSVLLLMFWIAPWLPERPKPESENGSAIEKPLPAICTVAPGATVVPPTGLPRDAAFCTLTTPPLTAVVPV